MTTVADSEVLGTARSNIRSGSTADAFVSQEEELLLFDPATDELIVIPKADSQAFLQEANQMQSIALDLNESRDALLAAEDELAVEDAKRFPDLGRVNAIKQKIAKARSAYDKAYAQAEKELKNKGYLTGKGDGKELIELIPMARRRTGADPKPMQRRWTYVRSEKMKSHWRKTRLPKDAGTTKSFLRNGKIDVNEFKKQMSKIDPKFKAEWRLDTAGFVFEGLQGWASALNGSSDQTKPVQHSHTVHLFRYFAGCGAGGEWKPKSGKIAGKINGKAEVMLAYGEAKVEGFVPGSKGWALSMTGAKTGKEFVIGAVRGYAAAKLSAAAGASAAAELSIEVDYSDLRKNPAIKGAKGPKAKGKAVKANLNTLGAEGSLGGDLFAGVKAGGEVELSFQYQSPESGDDFSPMAKTCPKVEVQWGAGAAAAFVVTFRGGKFAFRAKAGVCFGPGAKGEVGMEVDARRVTKFLEWFFHALLNAGFEFLEIVQEVAYQRAMQLQVLLVNGVTDAYEQLELRWNNFVTLIEREDQRVALMNRVLTNPPALRLCVPEAHGILLYQLSRHGKLTKTTHLAANSENWETLGKRKRAIMQVCQWAQFTGQFENMVQHMGPNGEKGSFAANYQHLLNFMEIGPGDSAYDDELRRLYRRLPTEPARGFPVALNYTPAFKNQVLLGASPTYLAQLQGVGLGRGTALA